MTCFDALGGFWRPFQCATVLGIRNTVKAAHRLWACQKICNAWESCWWSLGCLERPWNSCDIYIYIHSHIYIYIIYIQIHIYTHIYNLFTIPSIYIYTMQHYLYVYIYIYVYHIHIYIIGSDGWCIHDIGRHAGFTLMYIYIHIMYTHIHTYI